MWVVEAVVRIYAHVLASTGEAGGGDEGVGGGGSEGMGLFDKTYYVIKPTDRF